MPYRRILVPLDDSGPAQSGLKEALALAKPLGATLVLLHVIEPLTVVLPEMAGAAAWDALLHAQLAGGRRIMEAAHRAALAAGVDSEAVLHESDPRRVADVIVEHIGKHRCDLVVMGTHGRHGLRRVLVGSDAELVLRQSPVPVLLVRGSDDKSEVL